MLNDDDQIYRILGVSDLIRMFEMRENTLVRPQTWFDPMENLLKYGYSTPNGEIGEWLFCERYYAQCWSLESRSDAMWQAYAKRISPTNTNTEPEEQKVHRVRIRTSVSKLKSSIESVKPNFNGTRRIDKVKYYSDSKLDDFMKSHFNSEISGDDVIETFFVKRKVFSWEKEVRLVYFDVFDQQSNQNGGDFQYSWDPHSVIDQIMVPYYFSDREFKNFKLEFREKTGFTGKIKQSKLYEPPPDLVFNIP